MTRKTRLYISFALDMVLLWDMSRYIRARATRVALSFPASFTGADIATLKRVPKNPCHSVR